MDPKDTAVYLKLEGDETVYTLRAGPVQSLVRRLTDPLAYRDRTVLAVPVASVKRMSMSKAGIKQEIFLELKVKSFLGLSVFGHRGGYIMLLMMVVAMTIGAVIYFVTVYPEEWQLKKSQTKHPDKFPWAEEWRIKHLGLEKPKGHEELELSDEHPEITTLLRFIAHLKKGEETFCNMNFVIGVLSPIVVKTTPEFDILRKLTKEEMARNIYHSINGMATHNYKKYVVELHDTSERKSKDYGYQE